jgi:predicted protein tyrosine phosphatase
MNVLFICTENLLRSPTAECIFARVPRLSCASAGLSEDAETQVTAELLAWAEVVVCMEDHHVQGLQRRFPGALDHKHVGCLGIPDRYEFMDPDLIKLLVEKVPPVLAGYRPNST